MELKEFINENSGSLDHGKIAIHTDGNIVDRLVYSTTASGGIFLSAYLADEFIGQIMTICANFGFLTAKFHKEFGCDFNYELVFVVERE